MFLPYESFFMAVVESGHRGSSRGLHSFLLHSCKCHAFSAVSENSPKLNCLPAMPCVGRGIYDKRSGFPRPSCQLIPGQEQGGRDVNIVPGIEQELTYPLMGWWVFSPPITDAPMHLSTSGPLHSL